MTMPIYNNISYINRLLSAGVILLLLLSFGLMSEIIRLREILKRLNEDAPQRKPQSHEQSGFLRRSKSGGDKNSLEKDLEYWKRRSQEKRKLEATEEASTVKESPVEIVYLGGNNRLEMMKKLGITPTVEDFKKMVENLQAGHVSNKNATTLQNNLQTILINWFNFDRESLCVWAAHLQGDNKHYETALYTIERAWPTEDTQGFSRFLDMIRTSQFKENLTADAIWRFAATSPDFAAKLMKQVKNDSLLLNPVVALTKSMYLKDPGGTLRWIKSLSSSTLRDKALETYITHIASSDMDRAIRLIGEISGDSSQDTATSYMLRMAGSKFPEKAADIINGWPEGKSKDNLVRSFSYSISQTHPETAMLWADQIEEESAKAELMSYIATQWMDSDRDSFEKWFNKAELSTYSRSRIQKTYDNLMSKKNNK